MSSAIDNRFLWRSGKLYEHNIQPYLSGQPIKTTSKRKKIIEKKKSKLEDNLDLKDKKKCSTIFTECL